MTEEEYEEKFIIPTLRYINKKLCYPTRRKLIREIRKIVWEYRFVRYGRHHTDPVVKNYVLPRKEYTFSILNKLSTNELKLNLYFIRMFIRELDIYEVVKDPCPEK